MNVIGHPYIASKVFGRLTEDLVLGSFISDIVPFVPSSVFEFEEIHEGGEKFLELIFPKQPLFWQRALIKILQVLCGTLNFF